MNKQIIYICLTYVFITLLLGGSIIYRKIVHKDIEFLKNKIGIYSLNGWSISHLLLYIVLGYLAPDYWKELILIGVLFEIYEYFLEFIMKYKYVTSKLISDSIINSLGVLIGVLIAKS